MTPRFPFHVLKNKSVSFDTKLHRRFYFGKCTVKGGAWAFYINMKLLNGAKIHF